MWRRSSSARDPRVRALPFLLAGRRLPALPCAGDELRRAGAVGRRVTAAHGRRPRPGALPVQLGAGPAGRGGPLAFPPDAQPRLDGLPKGRRLHGERRPGLPAPAARPPGRAAPGEGMAPRGGRGAPLWRGAGGSCRGPCPSPRVPGRDLRVRRDSRALNGQLRGSPERYLQPAPSWRNCERSVKERSLPDSNTSARKVTSACSPGGRSVAASRWRRT